MFRISASSVEVWNAFQFSFTPLWPGVNLLRHLYLLQVAVKSLVVFVAEYIVSCEL
jgi:hypothetical protein